LDWDELLEGLDGEAREARRRLLDDLAEQGVPLEELKAAVAEDRLVLLPIERALMGPPKYSAHQVAEEAGVPVELLLEWRRISGTSAPEDLDARVFSDDDLEAARRIAGYVQSGIAADELQDALRVMAGSIARSADAIRRLFAETYLKPGDSEYELARRYGAMAETLAPLVGADLDYLMRLHLREFARSDALSIVERESGRLRDTVEVAVAFADIVGFTRLGTELPEAELGSIAGRLTELADQHVRRPARVVKTIGDAVMVVSTDPQALLASILDLVDAVEADDELPQIRAGVHWGPAVARMGDWYGGTVNVASRLTTRARPGSVLTTKELREAVGDDGYTWSDAGPKKLKGLGEPIPTFRVRRPGG
jgi:adenylate cyclase